MKTFSIYEPMSKEYFDMWIEKLEQKYPEYNQHPREDYHLQSDKYPIFVVADGVTLERDGSGNYPNPSGAAELAKIFCQTIIQEAERMYETFSEEHLKELFSLGNRTAGAYNLSQDRVKEKLDYGEFDLFAATTSFVLIKNNNAYWWSLCDAGVVLLNDEGKLIFHSPERGINNPKYLPKNWNALTVSEQNKAVRTIYRNTVNEEGNLIGYGVVTGENAAINYLHIGTIELKNNEVIILYTDGYENYFSLEKFLTVFKEWPDDLERQLKSLSNDIIKEKADIYGQERTLIAVTV